jgi:peptide/nickel transport system permease protein
MAYLNGRITGNEKRLFVVGAVLLTFFIILALLAPVIAPYDPDARVGAPFSPPDGRHLLGTNDLGQDIFSELVYGARVSITLGILAATAATVIGALFGIVAGYSRGRTEGVLMRITDLVLTLPFLPLVILVAAFLGPSFLNLVLVIGLITWPSTSRIVRSQVIKAVNKEYILSLKASGASTFYILRKHIYWEVLPIIVYRFMLTASQAILIEASLSFLGLGTPMVKSWGSILYYAQVRNAFLTDAWLWWILPPGLCISALSVSFLLLGYYVEARINPRLLEGPAGGNG